ncbi:TPA: hypothetical protein MBF53_000151 [Klebsiella aerogenes]|nr:hypothetical protein [Klebsiella aerogenes]
MSSSEKNYGGLADFLAKQLYPDLKLAIPAIFRSLKIPTKKLKAKRFKSPSSLLDALKSGNVKNNEFVVLECKPSTFGPYLRSHYLFPIIGSRTDMRLGPTLMSDTDGLDIFAMMAQISSHLKPVGLYPPINSSMSQVTLLPPDATCYGFLSPIPGVNELVPTISAIVSQDKINLCGASSLVTGIVRSVTQAMFIERDLPTEKYEELRQSGDIWYLDVCSAGTDIKPIHDGVVTELWGGLYASGHIEVDGGIQADALINGVMDSFKSAGYDPHFTQNMAENRDLIVYSKGMRFTLLPGSCIYTLHMDAELAIDYKRSRKTFDNVCDNLLEVILESAKKSDAKIMNPRDLDFTYTDSARSFSILESKAAKSIVDPVAMVVRDWHKKKGL